MIWARASMIILFVLSISYGIVFWNSGPSGKHILV